jgi:hypothetical protein
MEISFSSYSSADWPVLVATIDRFWDDLIAMDPYQRMVHPDEYGEVYSRELLAR